MPHELLAVLAAYADRRGGEGPFPTAIAGTTVLASAHPNRPMPLLHKPAICLVAQGAKRRIVGDAQYEYRAGEGLIVTIETPTSGWVSQATPEAPFLGLVIEFDLASLRELATELGPDPGPPGSGVFVAALPPPLTDCAARIVRLLDEPEAIPALAPLLLRELNYRLLTAPFGPRIAGALADGESERGVVAAIRAIRQNFARELRARDLAAIAHMSASTFRRRFKDLTSMTPVQYQKQLRLLEARHLMIDDGANAETAAFRVGYESQSHFSREYARMFGAPPRRHVVTLREHATRDAEPIRVPA